jgi:hypothetical protein
MTQASPSSPVRKNRSGRALMLRFAIVALILSILFVTLIGPPAPREISLYSGPEGSAFFDYGRRYA